MAKVKTIKIEVSGVEYSYNINVNKDGIFSLKIDWNVAEVLGIKNSFSSKELSLVEMPVIEAANAYRNASKTYSLHIEITYVATRSFSFESFAGSNKFKPNFHSVSDTPVIGLDYRILIREDIGADNSTVWYEAKEMDRAGEYQRDNYPGSIKIVDGYYGSKTLYSKPKETTIPFSQAAIETLEKAKNGLRGISEILYNVLNQEPGKIELALISNKLIG